MTLRFPLDKSTPECLRMAGSMKKLWNISPKLASANHDEQVRSRDANLDDGR
jgi:hypothetical protein